ncbi:MAG: hypothetical protein JW915_05805, partial [Chitinispirillaceae bacterium]|nr:hypothetical protein [Chitinispirillaceae bacterium]
FVHRRNFCSIPDYVPSWRNEENGAPVEEAALTDDLEIVSGPVTVTNPRWEHKKKAEDEVEVKVKMDDQDGVEDTENKASFGDTIILMADVTGMPEGSGITFDIYEMSEEPPMCVDTAKGKIQGGVGRGEWVVTDKSGKGEESKLAFEGIAKSKASVRCEIPVVLKEGFKVRLHIDPSAPESADDTYVLFSDDDSQRIIKTVKDDKVPGDNCIDLEFTDIKKDKKYSLVVDPGEDGAPYTVFDGIDGSVLLSDESLSYSEE